jgi:hypothetical protein
MVRASVLASVVLPILACSSGWSPQGLPHECTALEQDFVNVVVTPAPGVDAGHSGGSSNPYCLPPSLVSPDDAGRVECRMLVTLPGPGDESLCAEFGLDVPDPDVFEQLRARGPLRLPTCVVPQLLGSQFDATSSCAGSHEAGWCYVASPAGKACATIELSQPAIRTGTFVFECARGC